MPLSCHALAPVELSCSPIISPPYRGAVLQPQTGCSVLVPRLPREPGAAVWLLNISSQAAATLARGQGLLSPPGPEDRRHILCSVCAQHCARWEGVAAAAGAGSPLCWQWGSLPQRCLSYFISILDPFADMGHFKDPEPRLLPLFLVCFLANNSHIKLFFS